MLYPIAAGDLQNCSGKYANLEQKANAYPEDIQDLKHGRVWSRDQFPSDQESGSNEHWLKNGGIAPTRPSAYTEAAGNPRYSKCF